MITAPFAILQPFSDRLHTALFDRGDNVRNDGDVIRSLKNDARWPQPEKLVSLKQVHGKRVMVVRHTSQRIEEADGVITDQPGLTLTIRSADCQALLVFSPTRNVVGLIHAGWRGVDAGVIPEFFAVMKREWNIEPSEVFVAAGPSLCQKCADFTDPKSELQNIRENFFHGRHVDLQAAATDQLISLGMDPYRIERHRDCTRCHPETWWTYRGGHRNEVCEGATNVLACVMV